MAKSIYILIIDTLTERIILIDRVKNARKHFQLLLDFAASIINTNLQLRLITPRRILIELRNGILLSIEAGTNI